MRILSAASISTMKRGFRSTAATTQARRTSLPQRRHCTRCGTSANLNAAELQRTAILSLKAAIDRLGDLPNRELIVRMPSTYVA